MASDDKENKQIIAGFNRKLQSWGSSDNWTLGQFRILEDLIYDASKVRINAITLRRFFQQRTGSPQAATRNALCKFLGYESYNDFVMRNIASSEQEREAAAVKPEPALEAHPEPAPEPQPVEAEPSAPEPPKPAGKPRAKIALLSVAAILLIVLAVIGARQYMLHREVTDVTFELNKLKGTSPLTVQLTYELPADVLDQMKVVAVESNGDSVVRPVPTPRGSMFFSFVYPGLGHVKLLQNGRVIKDINVESRTEGWQAFVREEQKDYFGFHLIDTLYCRNGVLTLPQSIVPEHLRSDKLFITYTYYKPDLADGDNFSVEARVRNSEEDGGISCYDAMLYAFSDTGMHGFSLNREGYSYIKFISSENVYTGESHDFTNIGFDPSKWNTLKMTVANKKTTFYLNGEALMTVYYTTSIGNINEITLRFKGFGAVDYVKLYDADGKLIYGNEFDSIAD